MNGPVHFIHLGGDFAWPHMRAVDTARVHGSPIWMWTAADLNEQEPWGYHALTLADEQRPLDLPDWLRDHPIKLANVKDLYAWRILHEHGGIYLDLDTISLRPAWDLLQDGYDLCVGREYPEGDSHPHPYNSAAMIARKGSALLEALADAALADLEHGQDRWGSLGPHMLTSAVETYGAHICIAPYRSLNGWSYHNIGDYYANPRDPGEEARVIHLYSSDHLDEFYADRWTP